MIRQLILGLAITATPILGGCATQTATTEDLPAGMPATPLASTPDLVPHTANVKHHPDLGILVFEFSVQGQAGATTPDPAGQLDGAPVLGYVFPTNLNSEDVGFGEVEGIVALAITSHPDFDDTPLFDENFNRDYADDGAIWHPHWVVLNLDDRVPGGLSVKQFTTDDVVTLPPTNPGMPMYMDSPGFPVTNKGNTLRVVVPTYRVSNKVSFNYDAVACYMQVNASDSQRPMLGVYEVYGVLSGDLSLPYTVDE